MKTHRPLRVLHFVTGGFSGATQVAVDLCLAAQNARAGPVLLVLRRKRNTSDARVTALRTQGLDVQVIPGGLHVVTIWALYRLCRAWKPDVLVAHGFSDHIWGRLAGLWAGVKVLVQVEHNTRERYNWLRLHQSLWLARRTAQLVGVSHAVQNALLRRGHPPSRCTTIFNGVDLDKWSKGLPWSDRETAVVMPARFARAKDHTTLIRAMALLKQRGFDIACYLAGDGKAIWRKRAETLSHELGVEDRVHCLGRVSDMPDLMARVKFCVLSTHYEGLSLSLIEGMVAGCCAIGSNVEGVQEILQHGRTGYLFPENDAASLADTLEKLLRTDSVASAVAAAGREHARQTFDKRLMYPSYEKLFQALWAEKM